MEFNNGNVSINSSDSVEGITKAHFALVDKFLQQEYPLMARVFSTYIGLGINIRPVIVGGSSYRLHMLKGHLANDSIPTDDIDIKFFVDNPYTYTHWRSYRADLLADVYHRFRSLASNAGLNPTISINYRNATYDKAIVIDSEEKLQYIVSELKNATGFQSPVDLLCLTVRYPSSNGDVSLGLVDLSVVCPQESGYVYNMFANFRQAKDSDLSINQTIVDNNIELYKLDPEGYAVYSSYEYILLDTIRMIAKVEMLSMPGNHVSYADVYKYTKYVIKFYHLLFTRDYIRYNFHALHLESFMKSIEKVKLPSPANFGEFTSTLTDFHNTIKMADRSSGIHGITKWLENSRILDVVTMRGGGNSTNVGVSMTNIPKFNNVALKPIFRPNNTALSLSKKQTNTANSQTSTIAKFFQTDKSKKANDLYWYDPDWMVDRPPTKLFGSTRQNSRNTTQPFDDQDIFQKLDKLWASFKKQLKLIHAEVLKAPNTYNPECGPKLQSAGKRSQKPKPKPKATKKPL